MFSHMEANWLGQIQLNFLYSDPVFNKLRVLWKTTTKFELGMTVFVYNMKDLSSVISSTAKSFNHTSVILAIKFFKINMNTIKILLKSFFHEISLVIMRQLALNLITED